MKDDLNYLELRALVRELEKLVHSKIQKVYHPTDKEFVFNMYSAERGSFMLKLSLPKYIAITEYKSEYPKEPDHFTMFLRKYLTNAKITDVTKPDFERVIEIHLQKGESIIILVVELFSQGNLIVCDSNRQILVPLYSQSWKDRDIRPKLLYKYPPSIFELPDMDFLKFKAIIQEVGKNQIVKCLAIGLSLGGTYAEELCLISNVDKTLSPLETDDEQLQILFKNYTCMLEKFKEEKIEANIVQDSEGKAIDVQPFRLEIYKSNKLKFFDTYTEALDEFFAKKDVAAVVDVKKDEFEKEILKQEIILEQTRNYLKELEERSEEKKKAADLIYQHLGEIQEIVSVILEARENDVEWEQILQKIEEGKRTGNRSAILIKEISPSQGTLVLDLNSGIQLDFKKGVTDNANILYEKSKKFEGKMPGVKDQINKISDKIEKLRKLMAESPAAVSKSVPVKIVKAEIEWYEKFRWFFTSSGRLAIGGRDANQNEVLIKKYLDPEDTVFHADVHGSPFVILKKGRDASEEDVREAANFTLCSSKAWQNKRVEAVYWVGPHQVSKKAPSGEYIARGGFMIYGKKNYVKDIELRFAIGIETDPLRVISGPPDNVRHKARYYAIIIPGDLNKDQTAKQVKMYLNDVALEKDKEYTANIELDEIKRHCVEGSKVFGIV
ncbi:MAG TPA: fibronectin-binding domain-containing protein [Candidatus Woesearchaeota archaeon]|nr:fibronectin-binding domain-containing protein [Candidatus Woesearchaeota archaeon]